MSNVAAPFIAGTTPVAPDAGRVAFYKQQGAAFRDAVHRLFGALGG